MVGDPTAIRIDLPREKSCAHYWLIESPAGETSEGVCKLCGATRRFSNYSQRQTFSPTRKAPADPDNHL